MTVLDIVKYGTPSLTQRSEPVGNIDDDLRGLIGDMVETMYAAKGVGLAAPQVGRNIRLFVADADQVTRNARNAMVFINPEILDDSIEDGPYTEGCLSVPGIEAEVWRPLRVKVRALDAQGEPFEIEADDLLARVIQHEYDHLDGVLFLDRLAKAKRVELAGELSALRKQTQAELAKAG